MPYTPEEIARVNKNAMELMESLRPLLEKADPPDKWAKEKAALYEKTIEWRWKDRKGMNEPGWAEVHTSYEADWKNEGKEFRVPPWSLADLKGFRPLKDGEEYHRKDFTEDMLPEGWRPLLKGELFCADDELDHESHVHTHWTAHRCNDPMPNTGGPWFYRTRRPLPDPEREAFEKHATTYQHDITRLEEGYYNHTTHAMWKTWTAARNSDRS